MRACGCCRTSGAGACWPSRSPPGRRPDVSDSQRLDDTGRDELAQCGLGNADVAALAALAQTDEADTPLGDEPPRKALRRAKQLGGLGHGEEPVVLMQSRPPPPVASHRADLRAADPADRA